jgi:Tfp pilus assembly protein PilX
MAKMKDKAHGFTLIASLLMLLLLSGIAIGLLMSVNTEQRAGGNDLQNTMAYRSAEGGIEKMTADLANLFGQFQSPTATQITGLNTLVPTGDPTTSYVTYTLTPALKPDGTLNVNYAPVTTGPNQGLYAQTLPITLSVTANRLLGQEVSMTRQVDMALVPVFQFGVFSDSDLSFFAGVNLDFQGRVHTNGDLYLLAADNTTATFHDKVSAYGNIVRQQLPNGLAYNGAPSHNGTVQVLTKPQGCDGTSPLPNCLALGVTQGSVITGPTSGYNGTWKYGTAPQYNGWLVNGNNGNAPNTGVVKLQLPFVSGGGTEQFEIIRRPPPGGSSIDPSRLYTEAQISILISDDPAELPGGAADPQNIRLANVLNAGGVDYSKGVPAAVPSTLPVLASGSPYMTYFAESSTAIPDPSGWVGTAQSSAATLPADWPSAPLTTNWTLVAPGPPQAPLLTTGAANPAAGITLTKCTIAANQLSYSGCSYPYFTPPAAANTSTWNLIDGYLRVEVNVTGNATPVAVTRQWLQLGFARGTSRPTVSGAANPGAAGVNPLNPKAILLLQVPADRSGDGAPDPTGVAPICTLSSGKYSLANCTYGKPPEVQNDSFTSSPSYGDGAQPSSVSRNNWYPIDFYDQREGEARDGLGPAAGTCTASGVMNAVELDVGNLKYWLENDAVGKTVDKVTNNGYILYFSDRRGMQPSENAVSSYTIAGVKTGDSGLEDSINTTNSTGTPDFQLDTDYMAGRTRSPEDVNNNKRLDNVGTINLGNGFFNAGVNVNTKTPRNQYGANRIGSCLTTGRKNWVSGARHVLRLVDGGLGNVPLPGFTVGSENPVYIWGNYNTAAPTDAIPDPTWNPTPGAEPVHSASSVIADAVTMLSNSWIDQTDMSNPTSAGSRVASDTYYRTAICAGKNINFPTQAFAWKSGDYGTDGGLHNFLRLLEAWGGKNLYYKGSLVSLYYSTYATGTDKNDPYGAPARHYVFDPLFSSPSGLPPGTPMFRDVDNLSYRQDFTPRGGSDQ